MEKVIVGAILKKRIKEMGFTQEDFAEEVGIGLSTLRKYISGKTAYSYEVLELFSEKLQCSYNYLLGKSTSPRDEFHSATELTRLSEEALEKISKYASKYDTNFEGRRYIMCLDRLICQEGTFNSICDYLIASKTVEIYVNYMLKIVKDLISQNPSIKEIRAENDVYLSLEAQMMLTVILELKGLKDAITPDLIRQLKEQGFEEQASESIAKLKEQFEHN